jgi:hypothetical protein
MGRPEKPITGSDPVAQNALALRGCVTTPSSRSTRWPT